MLAERAERTDEHHQDERPPYEQYRSPEEEPPEDEPEGKDFEEQRGRVPACHEAQGTAGPDGVRLSPTSKQGRMDVRFCAELPRLQYEEIDLTPCARAVVVEAPILVVHPPPQLIAFGAFGHTRPYLALCAFHLHLSIGMCLEV